LAQNSSVQLYQREISLTFSISPATTDTNPRCIAAYDHWYKSNGTDAQNRNSILTQPQKRKYDKDQARKENDGHGIM